MATTTTSKKRSANTKTSKKPVKTAAAATKKASKKSVSKKPANKPAVKATTKKVVTTEKVVEKKAVVKKVRTPRALTAATIRKWHLVSAFLFAASAAAVAFLAKASTIQLTLPHATKDELASGTQTVFAPAAHVMLDIDVRWYLVAVLVVSATFSLARATRLKAVERRDLEARVSTWRWVDFALTIGALVALVALFFGIQDYVAVKFMGISVVASYFFAWLAEREVDVKQAKRFGVAGIIAGLLPWFFVATALYGTYLYGMVRLTWYVYAVAAVVFVGQYFIARNQRLAARATNYLFAERNYVALNLLTKIAVAAIVVVGLYK